MRTPTAASLLVVSSLLAPVHATAEDVPGAPDVLVLSTKIQAGTAPPLQLTRLTPRGEATIVLDALPTGSYHLDAHQATGRWLLTFGELSNGEPLTIGGEAVSNDVTNTLVLGEGDKVVATTQGDRTCTRNKKVCFEQGRGFTPDGAYVFVESMRSTWSTWGRWTFGARPKRVEVVDKKLGAGLAVSPDGKTAAYVAKDGIHVTAWPAQPASAKKKAPKLKATKKAVANPTVLMSELWPIGDRVYYLRREPVEQKLGWYEAYDAGDRKTITLLQAPTEFPMGYDTPVRSTGPRRTAVFTADVGFERRDLYEVAEDGDAPVRLAGDVRQLLDVSDDGRYALLTRRKDPAKGNTIDNPELLVIFDLVDRRDVKVLDVRGTGTVIEGAHFVAAAGGS